MTDRTQVIITIGAPGSGKSTWARRKQAEMSADDRICAIIERDMIRDQLFGVHQTVAAARAYYGQDVANLRFCEAMVSDMHQAQVVTAIDIIRADTIIIADCNASLPSLTQTRAEAAEAVERVKIKYVYFCTQLSDVLERNRSRANSAAIVPDDVVRRMHESAGRVYSRLLDDGVEIEVVI